MMRKPVIPDKIVIHQLCSLFENERTLTDGLTQQETEAQQDRDTTFGMFDAEEQTLGSVTPILKKVIDKPQNGFAGLKHWRSDLLAGFLVAMISTPFSIGIAVASGAPPITGLTSAIIAGFVLPFLGGSFVTISGPAAGLAPILYASMLTLGSGSLTAGYPLLLPVILLAGVIQLILSQFKAARYSAIFPAPVVGGMLASIGLMIIAKQLPTLLGHKFLAHEFWGILLEAPHELFAANYTVLTLGLITLVLIFTIASFAPRIKLIRVLSPQLFAVVAGTLISGLFLHLDPDYLIHIPENPLAHGITFPDFAGLIASRHLWMSAFTIAITLTLIDGIESLATINAIDKIDPYHRKSDPDKTLFAMGVSNICSSLAGGLTIIPGGVKSTANIMAGGKTQWANFYNACFLLMFLLFFHQQISTIPLAVLSAVLVYTGYKLCKPKVWREIFHVGGEQLLLFTATVLITLTTDLMWGILGGVALTYVLNALMLFQVWRKQAVASVSYGQLLKEAFDNPVAKTHFENEAYTIAFNRSLLCFNYLHVMQALKQIPPESKYVNLVVMEQVLMIDHTIMDNLAHWMLQCQAETGASVQLIGLDRMRKMAPSAHATHLMASKEMQLSVS